MYTNLNFHPQANMPPQHVAIIPDGGRRWARQHGMSYKEAYLITMKKMAEMAEVLYQDGIKHISLFFASTQNFFRTEEEIQNFYEAEFLGVKEVLGSFAAQHHIDLKIVGKYDERYRMPERNPKFVRSEKKLFICFNYSSLDEIEAAVGRKKHKEESFVNYLEIPHPVDILIRTGGAQTLSGFMLPQLAFARLFFLDKLFNDLTVQNVRDIVGAYREYGLKYGE